MDGHNPTEIATAIGLARNSETPSLIACRTTIGYGAPTKQGTAAAHGAPLGDGEIAAARERLGWPHEPFVIPDNILGLWRTVGVRGAKAFADWTARLTAWLPNSRPSSSALRRASCLTAGKPSWSPSSSRWPWNGRRWPRAKPPGP